MFNIKHYSESATSFCPRESAGKTGPPCYKITGEQLDSLLATGFSITSIARKGLLGTKCRKTIYNHMKRQNVRTKRNRYSLLGILLCIMYYLYYILVFKHNRV